MSGTMIEPGHVRTVNLRGHDGIAIEPDETAIRVDRANPIFGNPYHMLRRNDPHSRDIALSAYRQDLQKDIARNGPINQEIELLAQRLNTGENLALQCWCAPLPCHGDFLVQAIRKAAERHREMSDDPHLQRERPNNT